MMSPISMSGSETEAGKEKEKLPTRQKRGIFAKFEAT
jgi:hypothetical protein